MGTRGAVGFYKDGKEKVGYNHWDSYPSGLGQVVVNYLKGKTIDELKKFCDEIKLTGSHNALNDEEEFNSEFEDYKTFLHDSLFCEYAYIINLDTGMLEFYTGFNQDPDAKGRYAKFSCDDYNGVVLKQEIPLEFAFKGKVFVFGEYGFVFER